MMQSPRNGLMLPPAGSRTPRQTGLVKAGTSTDEALFDSPAELVCPLTLNIFLDPVLTTAGHVYERQPIQAHLERSSTDPLTRQALLNQSLTPVFVLRSRALEFRESVARDCISRVCSGVPDPMRYLRRAVELIAETGSHVQGLSKETCDFVLSHSSNAFDKIALQLFAQGLFQAGYRDRAATIYGTLLLEDVDKGQQAECLKQVLSCWTEEPSGVGQGGDHYVFEKLVRLFEGRSLNWEGLVELAEQAKLGDTFVLRLCEQLLFRQGPGAPLLAPGSSSSGSPRTDSATPGATATTSYQEKRLLLKYVHVLTGSLQHRQTEVERRLQELERWRQKRGSRSRSSGNLFIDGSSPRNGAYSVQMPAWVRHPAAIGVCMLLTTAVPSDHGAARILRAVPFLALLPSAAS